MASAMSSRAVVFQRSGGAQTAALARRLEVQISWWLISCLRRVAKTRSRTAGRNGSNGQAHCATGSSMNARARARESSGTSACSARLGSTLPASAIRQGGAGEEEEPDLEGERCGHHADDNDALDGTDPIFAARVALWLVAHASQPGRGLASGGRPPGDLVVLGVDPREQGGESE